MEDISNRTLALFLVTAIIISLGTTVYTLNKLSGGTTGRASTDSGNVTLTVQQDLSILLNVDTVNWGAGAINATKCNNATLTAGAAYNVPATADPNDCWTNNSLAPGPLLLENNGNVNASVSVVGPVSGDFFNGYAGFMQANLSWEMRNNETTACTEIVTAASNWQEFTGGSQGICDNMRYFPENQDEIAIDMKVFMNVSIPSGTTYENSTITFTAVAS
ncbi:MAG: hypothetical protein HGA85_03245 [Nanoarchaeota archaeon]|nr:hypothetical protein [Nanoarchaeota archaeon]